jgi:hypothetical protein
MYFSARRPCFKAFRAERALPSGLFGPRDLAPFFRLAAARALLTGTAARGRALGARWFVMVMISSLGAR